VVRVWFVYVDRVYLSSCMAHAHVALVCSFHLCVALISFCVRNLHAVCHGSLWLSSLCLCLSPSPSVSRYLSLSLYLLLLLFLFLLLYWAAKQKTPWLNICALIIGCCTPRRTMHDATGAQDAECKTQNIERTHHLYHNHYNQYNHLETTKPPKLSSM
jgi:hypothetical protein